MTIIVVLLALLVPAMDKAIYQADDGSVIRLNDMPTDNDPRTAHVPNIGNQSKPGIWINMAKP